MRHSIRRQLSFANVVSVLALLVALGGTSYAAVVLTGRNIKDGTLTGKDVKDRSLGRKELSTKATASLTGATGATGATGPEGPQGHAGADGAPAPTNAITGANVVNRSLTLSDLAGVGSDGSVSVSG